MIIGLLASDISLLYEIRHVYVDEKGGNENQQSEMIKDIVDDTHELCETLVLRNPRATPRERCVGVCQLGSTGTATMATRKNHL